MSNHNTRLEQIRERHDVHYRDIAHADDIAEGGNEEISEDYERYYCNEDGEDWPCTEMKQEAPSDLAYLLSVVAEQAATIADVVAISDIRMTSENGDPAFVLGWECAIEEMQARTTSAPNKKTTAMSAQAMAEVIGDLWDQGNCTGLDGWVGPGRGQSAVDDEAIYARARDVAKAVADLTAAGFGHIETATDLIRDMTDPDPCHFDHHGGCQAHGYLSLEHGETCPQDDAKRWAIDHPRKAQS